MKDEINKDITDSDIDQLFNNNNTDVLKDIVDEKIEDIVPKELSIQNDDKPDYVDRPSESMSEKTRVKKEIEKVNVEINSNIESNISDVKKLTSLDQLKHYLRKLNDFKNKEHQKQITTKQILSGCTTVNFDPSTECTFHIYVPKDILGNQIHCYCKYCSAYKMFLEDEWNDYCVKYRKWF